MMEEQPEMLQNESLLAELTAFITEALQRGEDFTTPRPYRFGDQVILITTNPEDVYEMARVSVEERQFFVGPDASSMQNGVPPTATP